MKNLACLACSLLLLAPSASAAADRWWAGGGVGLGFGDITYVSVEPMVGYHATDKIDVGGRLIFRYRDDERYSPSLSTTDYGASVFARYAVKAPFFLQAEYEWLSYEIPFTDGSTDRDNYDSILVGGGFAQRMGDRSSFFVSALYNFSYDDNEPSPYTDPWVIRVGVGFGF
jgi:hypothetical protein